MKKCYFLLMSVLVSVSLWSQLKTWNGGNGSWTDGSKWTPSGPPPANSFIVFSDGSSAVITNVPTITLRRITVTGNTGITLQSTAANVLTIDNVSGTEIVIQTGSSLAIGTNVDVTLDVNSTANITGVLTINTGRTYTTDKGNSNTNVAGTIDNKGVINAKGNGNSLSFGSGASYIHSQNGGTVPDADWNVNSKCIVTGVIDIMPASPNPNTGFDQMFGNFIWNSPGQTAGLSFDRELKKINGDLIITSTGTGSISLANTGNFATVVDGDYMQTGGRLVISRASGEGTLGIRGNYIQSGGTLVINQTGGDGTLAIGGNFNMSAGELAKNNAVPASSSKVNFGGTRLHVFTKTGGTITGNIDFEVPTGSSIDFGQSILDGSAATFTLLPGAKIITSNANGLNSTGALGSIQTGVRSFSSGADYEFRGSNTGVFSTTPATTTVRNFLVNNATAGTTLAQPKIVTGALTLMNGYLTTTATNLLTIGTAGTASTTNGAFVNGPLAKNTNSILADPFIFPVGKVVGGLRTIGIYTTSIVPSTFVAQFFRTAPATGTLGTGITRVSACEYWDLARPSGAAPARVMLSWASGSACNGSPYVTDQTTLRVAHLLAGTWLNRGRLTSTGDNTAGTITSSDAVATFSPFALASSSAIENPLPVVLANVKAYEKNNGVQIEWSNLTEKEVAIYTIESSANGIDFRTVDQQSPTSNQSDKSDYNAFDANPNSGVSYYRIKVQEANGKIVYSKVLIVNLGISKVGLQFYPNPVTGNQVTISLSNVRRGQYTLRIINIAGQDVFRQTITSLSSRITQTIDLPLSVKPGFFNMVITGNDYRESKMFIVQ